MRTAGEPNIDFEIDGFAAIISLQTAHLTTLALLHCLAARMKMLAAEFFVVIPLSALCPAALGLFHF